MKYKLLFLLVLSLFITNKVNATTPTIKQQTLIETYSSQYNVRADRVYAVLACESGFKSIQSNYVDKYGHREDSWGIAQINLPYHLEITKEQAMDEDFSIEWLVKQFSLGHARMWACYQKLFM